EKEREGAAAVARRHLALDRHRRSQLAWLDGHERRPTRAYPAPEGNRRRGQSRGIQTCAAVGYERIESLSRGYALDLRQDSRFAGTARAGFHRSGANQDD